MSATVCVSKKLNRKYNYRPRMARRAPFGLEDRIRLVARERGIASVNTFVDDPQLVGEPDPVEQPVEHEYEETVTLHGHEVAPFMFTKGMPLERDDEGRRYPEGFVPADRMVRNYRDPIRNRSSLAGIDEFERGGGRLFIGVPGVHSINLSGMDPWRGVMPPAPDPRGARNAAEMVDVYAMEQVRDVPFVEWPNEPGDDAVGVPYDVVDAVETDLTAATGEGALDGWWYDTDRLFVEADTDEVDWGPYVSQFLLRELKLWALNASQEYLRYPAGEDYNDTREAWLDTVEGRGEFAAETNPNQPPSDNKGHIATPRHLATVVNAEPPFQEYLIATIQLLGDVDFDPGLPYTDRDDGNVFAYTDTGPVGLLDMLTRVARQALLAAFYQKYYVHFRCRPETYGGRVHAQRNLGADIGVPSLLTDAEILSVREGDEDYLSTAYIEGSPVHPAYPSGHSVIAGACGTVLKTWFTDVAWPYDDYYVPTADGQSRDTIPLPSGHTGVYQEIDKLMSNVGLARMFAGVHYYSDHYWGVKLGEQVAVGELADVFERNFEADESILPTFRPYLEYGADAVREVSVATLDDLRQEAASREG